MDAHLPSSGSAYDSLLNTKFIWANSKRTKKVLTIRNRSFGSRPMGASILPVSRVGVPSTIARYLRRTDLRANCSCKPACAAASFAITSNPEVPLSMRCTTPVNKTYMTSF